MIKGFNLKTLFFNFRYLPFREAIKFPIYISRRVYLRTMAGSVSINAPIKRGMIQIGYGDIGIFDKKHSRSIWQVSGQVVFNGKAFIGHGSKLSVKKEGRLVIGAHFIIGAEVQIVAFHHVEFGNDTMIGWDTLIMDTDHHFIYDQSNKLINPNDSVIIGNHVWIGVRNVILKGSKVADGSVIGANSFLTKDISNRSGIFVGNPIRLVKDNITWECYERSQSE